MAKYILSRTASGYRTAKCSILDENCLANTYTVQFDNGVIKNVSKRKVTALDRIDEAVLDRLKQFASDLWDNMIKAGKYIYFTVGNKLAKIVSPINTMIAAKNIDGVSFIPSETLAGIAEESGISAEAIIDDSDVEDEVFCKDANNFWKEVIKEYKKAEKSSSKNESIFVAKKPKLYEERLVDIKLSHKSWVNVNTKELQEKILSQFFAYRHGAGKRGSGKTPIPYCIWGAPGIGKTQIINSLIDKFRERGVDANILSINAMSMRKDDFSLPGQKTEMKTVKNAKGETVSFGVGRATELPKSWLPLYDPSLVDNGITEDQLDDIANGGDGSGNGQGGFIFIDELSRIDPEVMNVIMVLVQSRTFNDMVLGSKWMFVAAANRLSDLAGNDDRFSWDAAQTGRFTHVNFVPTFDEWVAWAESPIKGTKRPHIHADFVSFLKEHEEFWYNSMAANTEDPKDLVARTMYPNSRGWEIASKNRYEVEDSMKKIANPAEDDDEAKMFADVYDELGLDRRDRELSGKEVSDILRQSVGNKAADVYKGWATFDNVFNTKVAKTIWTLGDKADIPFAPSNLNIKAAVEKVLAVHPKYDKLTKTPGSQNERVPMTPNEFANLCKWIVKCVDKVDSGQGLTGTPVFNAACGQLLRSIQAAPYFVNLTSVGPDMTRYQDGITILDDCATRCESTIVNHE